MENREGVGRVFSVADTEATMIKGLLPAMITSLLLLLSPGRAPAAVVVHDCVAVVNKAVMLEALTKGRLFPEGGRIVDFYVDGKRLGSTLSGGDGYAYMEYTPRQRGVRRVEVRSGSDRATAVVLVVGTREKALLVEVEGALRASLFSGEPRVGSLEAIEALGRRFRVIYLTRLPAAEVPAQWLRDRGFPASALLRWNGPGLVEELKASGIRVYAIIASPSVAADAAGYIEKRFTFEESDDAVVAEGWKEVTEGLQ